MAFWLILPAAIVLATRLLATSKGSQRLIESTEGLAGWSPALKWFAAVAGAAGLALRLYGLDASFFIDEFGTLWTVEGDLAAVVDRATSFHGQSPFYYLICWAFVRLFGESEIVLRLPSVIGGAGAAWLIYRTGALIDGPRAGVLSAVAFWLAYMPLSLSAEARPYGLALLCTSALLYGFLKAASDGRATGRVCFVLGGVGVIAAHYIVALALLGIGVGYLVTPALRERYPPRRFSLDVAAMILLAAPLFPQLFALWSRRSELIWIPAISFNAVSFTFAPAVALIAAGVGAGAYWQRRTGLRGAAGALLPGALAPPLVLILLAYMGTNLLAPRYLIGGLPAACLLAGAAVALVPARFTAFGWFGWAMFGFFSLYASFLQAGSFTGVGHDDWRGATAELNRLLRGDREIPVLYRSGFIEGDQLAYGREVSPALESPLRSPGQTKPDWNIVALPYNWDFEEWEEYLDRTVPAAVQGQEVFYFLSCDCSSGAPSAGYPQQLTEWAAKRFGNRYRAEPVAVGRGMIAIRFEAASSGEDLGTSAATLKGTTL